jgi:hypothetical protein|uniref:Lipoprotein n=1 Tax=Desulfobacca acetoxidans TaxID=60893 RepID=A0A7C3UW89_9BACT
MRPSTEPTLVISAKVKLGLFFLSLLPLLVIVACASPSNRITRTLIESQEEVPAAPGSQPTPQRTPKPAENPLQVCAVVPDADLQEMRGCLGVYYFDYNFDINLVTNPQVSITTNFGAVVPDGSPSPTFNGSTAVFQDSNVSYIAGPTNTGLNSQLVVTGRDNIVFATTQFNIHLPNASSLIPNISVMPGVTLTGIGPK